MPDDRLLAAADLGDRGAANRRELERDLHAAVAAGAFRLHWQPIVHCLTGRLHRFEALVRWDRPGTGPVAPAVFVPIAELLGLHRPLDLWVLRHAMQEAASWPKAVRVAVNVSAMWFHGEGLSRAVEALLAETGLEPGRLELEVTERVFIGDDDMASRELAQLRAMGVGLSLDDFGTGYSALSYLRTVAFTKLKLDRVFVENLGSCRRTEVITRAVLTMGAGLGMLVCAEGVSHQAQLDMLQAYGCDEAQGYLIGKPAALTPARMAVIMKLDRSSLFHGPVMQGPTLQGPALQPVPPGLPGAARAAAAQR